MAFFTACFTLLSTAHLWSCGRKIKHAVVAKLHNIKMQLESSLKSWGRGYASHMFVSAGVGTFKALVRTRVLKLRIRYVLHESVNNITGGSCLILWWADVKKCISINVFSYCYVILLSCCKCISVDLSRLIKTGVKNQIYKKNPNALCFFHVIATLWFCVRHCVGCSTKLADVSSTKVVTTAFQPRLPLI